MVGSDKDTINVTKGSFCMTMCNVWMATDNFCLKVEIFNVDSIHLTMRNFRNDIGQCSFDNAHVTIDNTQTKLDNVLGAMVNVRLSCPHSDGNVH